MHPHSFLQMISPTSNRHTDLSGCVGVRACRPPEAPGGLFNLALSLFDMAPTYIILGFDYFFRLRVLLYNLDWPQTHNPAASAYQVAGITGIPSTMLLCVSM